MIVSKTVIVLWVICVALAVGFAGTLTLLSQKDAELQININKVSELENQKLSLAS